MLLNRGGLAEFKEQDIASLFSVISGHFLLGGNSDVDLASTTASSTTMTPLHLCPEPGCGKNFNQASVLEKHRNLACLLLFQEK